MKKKTLIVISAAAVACSAWLRITVAKTNTDMIKIGIDMGTNWMTVTNALRFNDSYVICVTPSQWRELTNAYANNPATNVIHFYRK